MQEPFVEDLTVFQGGFLGFDLRADLSNDEAEALARQLNESVTTVSFTHVPGWTDKR